MLGIPAAALRFATDAPAIAGVSTGVVQQLKLTSMQSEKQALVVVHQLMPKLVLHLKLVRMQHLMP